jgi:hypothetical protein
MLFSADFFSVFSMNIQRPTDQNGVSNCSIIMENNTIHDENSLDADFSCFGLTRCSIFALVHLRAVPLFARWIIDAQVHFRACHLRAALLMRWSIYALVNKPLIIALVCHCTGPLVIARSAYHCAGGHINALNRISWRWTTDHCAGPLTSARDRLCLRRSAYPCADPLSIATIRLCLRRSAYPCADPLSTRWTACYCAGPLNTAPIRLSMR